jgi:septum formation protein
MLILASSSRYRAELLSRLGLDFDVRRPEVDESPLPGESPAALVARLAHLKAATVATQFNTGLIVGSDQVAVCGAQVLGKPGTPERARAQLAALSGRSVEFLTGLCLMNAATGAFDATIVPTVVQFRTLTADEIADYVRREQPLDCAGAFKSEGLGIALFERLESDDPTALIGLPLIELCRMLGRAGVAVLGRSSGR